jgi:hypothetical protein
VSPSGGENYDYNCLVALGIHPTFVHFPLDIQLSLDRQPYVFMMHPRYTHALIYHFTSHSSRSECSWREFPGSSITLTFHFQVRPFYRFHNIRSPFSKYRLRKASIWKQSIKQQENTVNLLQVKKDSILSIKCMYTYSRLFAVCCKDWASRSEVENFSF